MKPNQDDMFGSPPEVNAEIAPGFRHPRDVNFTSASVTGKIISVRGTNGSGKTTVVRRVMELFSVKAPVYIDGRKNPYYYMLANGDAGYGAVIIGSYENTTGGCDTISGTAPIYELVKMHALAGRDVIFEGLMHAQDVNHTTLLTLPQHLIYLATTQEECIASTKTRRAAAGNEKELDPKNLISKYKGVQSAFNRTANLPHVTQFKLSREDAFQKVRELIGV